MIHVLGLALYGTMAASTRYRLQQYRPGLAASGINLEVSSLLGNEYLAQRFNAGRMPWGKITASAMHRLRRVCALRRYDCAILYCELFPLLPGAIERRLLTIPYIYDFDDAFYLKYRSGRLRSLSRLLGSKFDTVIRHAAAVTAGSRVLSTYAASFNGNVSLLPTVVDTERYLPGRIREHSIFTVGWIGSPTTAAYLARLVEPLARLAREGPVRFVVIGGEPPAVAGVEVVQMPWSEDTEIALINGFDVGVMPLDDDEWSRGKCAFKAIQYMACGVPVVASPVGASRDVLPSTCGFLAEGSDDWLRALRFLRDNPVHRLAMGECGRARVEREYSLRRNLPVLGRLIEAVCGKSSCAD